MRVNKYKSSTNFQKKNNKINKIYNRNKKKKNQAHRFFKDQLKN